MRNILSLVSGQLHMWSHTEEIVEKFLKILFPGLAHDENIVDNIIMQCILLFLGVPRKYLFQQLLYPHQTTSKHNSRVENNQFYFRILLFHWYFCYKNALKEEFQFEEYLCLLVFPCTEYLSFS